jgi:hypothetical protein
MHYNLKEVHKVYTVFYWRVIRVGRFESVVEITPGSQANLGCECGLQPGFLLQKYSLA